MKDAALLNSKLKGATEIIPGFVDVKGIEVLMGRVELRFTVAATSEGERKNPRS